MKDYNSNKENETIREMTIGEMPDHLRREFGVTRHADENEVVYVKYVDGSSVGMFESLDDALE